MKRIFTFLALSAMLLTAHAQNAGDYVYTGNGRYKIVSGENLLSNGDFSNRRTDWVTDGGNELSPDTFDIEIENGDGRLLVTMKEDGPNNGCSLYRKVPVSNGATYFITYQVSGQAENVVTTVKYGDRKNYQNIFFNTDGSTTPAEYGAIATAQEYTFDWSTFNYGFKAPADGFIVLHFYAMFAGTRLDNFKVMQAVQVVDDREANALFAHLQSYIDNPLFPNGNDILESAIGALRESMDNDDLDGYTEMLTYIDGAISEFLDANTANANNYVKNINFDDLATTKANQRKAGAWTIDDATPASGKTRWAVKDAVVEGVPLTGMFLQDDIPGPTKTSSLEEATVYQMLENMPAAKYMFTVKARACNYKDKNYTVDTKAEITGLKAFINSDSTELVPVDHEKANTFIVFSDMTETGSMKIGLYVPGKKINHVDFDVVDLRLIGWTAEQLDEYFQGKEFAEARAALKHHVDSAATLYNNPDYLYGKVDLATAIDEARPIYDAEKDVANLTAATATLGNAIATYHSVNNRLMVLRKAIDRANGLLSDANYTAGKEQLSEAITNANNFISTLTEDNHDQEGTDNNAIAQQTTLLNNAINDLLIANTKDDVQMPFVKWATEEDASYASLLATEPTENTSGKSLYIETAPFAGHDLQQRIALNNTNTTAIMNANGLQIGISGKRIYIMSVLGLNEGDQVTLDWTMGNASHDLYALSGNVKYTKADGTLVTLTSKDETKTENVLPKNDNTLGLSGSCRTIMTMTAAGTLDLYLGNSNSTVRIYYLGITAKENVVDGITTINSEPSTVNQQWYNLRGQRVEKPSKGLYIHNGRKYIVR